MMSEPRLSIQSVAPDAYRALSGVEAYVRQCGLEKPLLALVKIRASQLNGCAFCLEMHRREAMHAGETAQRLLLLDAWRESSLYSARERAALAWTECLTHISTQGAPESVYAGLSEHFTAVEIANLSTAIGMINLWNRLMVGFAVPHAAAA